MYVLMTIEMDGGLEVPENQQLISHHHNVVDTRKKMKGTMFQQRREGVHRRGGERKLVELEGMSEPDKSR